ncbi:GGDEF domain-containing protein [Uliginosibacterium gangwonense]|uniref:GGDEF domain-containing protein n=1 Tax=Uliginosibacterium gangwonense TaxID=392736 RepID=UPI00035D540A|nr:GGDEF domain-containing protein [Uliginosibacterium gangwonense]
MSDNLEGNAAVAVEHTVIRLNHEVKALRAEVLALRQKLADAQQTHGEPHNRQLLEANEHLVIAALQADMVAEIAKSDLVELARTSQHDALTEIPNRTLMLDLLEHSVAISKRNRTRFALIFLDLDQFKQVNDEMGHAIGDEVLRHTACCVQSVLRDSDTVSRQGGDEFLVLLNDVLQISDAEHIAQKILHVLSTPYKAGEHTFRLSASLGIAMYPEDGKDPASLIAHADAAMYRSKKRGPGGFAFHTAGNQD